LAATSRRERKIQSGTSGARARFSISTNAPTSSSETAKSEIVCAESQPASGASVSA
jgi:hypothetical protein